MSKYETVVRRITQWALSTNIDDEKKYKSFMDYIVKNDYLNLVLETSEKQLLEHVVWDANKLDLIISGKLNDLNALSRINNEMETKLSNHLKNDGFFKKIIELVIWLVGSITLRQFNNISNAFGSKLKKDNSLYLSIQDVSINDIYNLNTSKLTSDNISKLVAEKKINITYENVLPNPDLYDSIFPAVKNKDKLIEESDSKLISESKLAIQYIANNISKYFRDKKLMENNMEMYGKHKILLDSLTSTEVNHLLDDEDKAIYLFQDNENINNILSNFISGTRYLDLSKITNEKLQQLVVDKRGIFIEDTEITLSVSPKSIPNLPTLEDGIVEFDIKHFKDNMFESFKKEDLFDVYWKWMDHENCSDNLWNIALYILKYYELNDSIWFWTRDIEDDSKISEGRIKNWLNSQSRSTIKSFMGRITFGKEENDDIKEIISNVNEEIIEKESELANLGVNFSDDDSLDDLQLSLRGWQKKIGDENKLRLNFGLDGKISLAKEIDQSVSSRKNLSQKWSAMIDELIDKVNKNIFLINKLSGEQKIEVLSNLDPCDDLSKFTSLSKKLQEKNAKLSSDYDEIILQIRKLEDNTNHIRKIMGYNGQINYETLKQAKDKNYLENQEFSRQVSLIKKYFNYDEKSHKSLFAESEKKERNNKNGKNNRK